MTQLRIVCRPLPALPELAGLWRDLEARADSSFFLSWHWIGAWLKASGLAPVVLEVRAGERVVGLALLQAARQRRHGLIRSRRLLLHEAGDAALDVVAIEYNGILSDREQAPEVRRTVIDFLVRGDDAALPAWDELRFGGVPTAYEAALGASGLAVHVAARGRCTTVDLPALRAAGQPYLATLGPNTRQQIRRAMRHYEMRGPLAVKSARDLAEAERFFASLEALHEPSWRARGKRGAFSQPFARALHRQLIADSFADGGVELLRIAAGEHVVGYLYNFLYRGWVGAYMSGFQYEADARVKPGLVSFALAIERHEALGNRTFDFLAGESRYKASLGEPGEELLWLDLQRPRLAFRIESGLRCLRQALRPR